MIRLTAEPAWRHALDLKKPAIEVGNIVEADFKADVRYLLVGLHQQLAGMVDADAIDEVGEGVSGGAAENAREPAFTQAKLDSHF